MGDTTRPAVPCHQCGAETSYLVLVNFVEAGSGPGCNIYNCLECACRRYKDHVQGCRECRFRGSCQPARSLRRSILEARRDREMDRAVEDLKQRGVTSSFPAE